MASKKTNMQDKVHETKEILRKNRNEVAFVIGNGINRYNNQSTVSWQQMITKIWENSLETTEFNSNNLQGMSLTELYDLIVLHSSESMTLKDSVVTLTNTIKRSKNHDFLQKKFQEINAPVLTMNFDLLLEHGLKKFRLIDSKKFSDFYPWSDYYGDKELQNPLDGFAIWHINGIITYKRSIRLSLSEYMKQVVRTDSYLRKGNSLDEFNAKSNNNWNGINTWLHIIFNKSLFIFGLALNQDEIFLRWLLIQREKYFKKFPQRKKQGWFVCLKDETNDGTKFFLKQLDFQIIELDSYTDIYESIFDFPS